MVAKRSCLIELQFFPKTEKYVSLFTGGDDSDIIDRRNKLRKQIKANLVAAAASGKDLEGTLLKFHSQFATFWGLTYFSYITGPNHGLRTQY